MQISNRDFSFSFLRRKAKALSRQGSDQQHE